MWSHQTTLEPDTLTEGNTVFVSNKQRRNLKKAGSFH
jgi:hypothetical protein